MVFGDRKRRVTVSKWYTVPAVAAMLLVTACTKEAVDMPAPSGPATATVVPSDVALPSGCTAWAEPPATGGLEVYWAWLEYTGPSPEIDRVTNWTVIIYNRSDLMAVGMGLKSTFTLDGKDVTDELEVQPGGAYSGTVKPRENTHLMGVLESPPSWKHSAKFTATVTAENWCIPTPS